MTATQTAARRIVQKPISKLQPWADNPRKHPKPQLKQLAALLEEYGWTSPVIVDEDNRILAGHGRVLAAQQLGHKRAPCVVVAGLNEEQKKAYVVADNRAAEKSRWDKPLLGAHLKGLSGATSLTGFSAKDLTRLTGKAKKPKKKKSAANGVRADAPELPEFGVIVTCPDLTNQCAVHIDLEAMGLACLGIAPVPEPEEEKHARTQA